MKKHRIINVLNILLFFCLSIQAKQMNKPVVAKPAIAVEKKLAKAGIAKEIRAPINDAAILKITYGFTTHQNKRDYQEDRFTHATIDGGDFFGVYDGHGGAHVSSFLAEELYKIFEETDSTVENKFKNAFAKAERGSCKFWPKEGSTALVTYIDKNKMLYCAWVGDTRAVLECNNKVCFFTKDHKPDREDEKQRIEKAGGMLYKQGVWRVNGLAISRSIGDLRSKMGAEGQIIAIPEYKEINLNSDNHFLILASDGLWDVIKNEEAVEMVNKALKDKMGLNDIAKMLQDAAMQKRSKDNITVCVVKFDWDTKNTAQPVSVMTRFWNWLRGK